MTGRKRLYLATAVIFGLFISFSYLISDAFATPLTLGSYSQTMWAGGYNQTLTVSGGDGGPYSWYIVGGAGTLSSSTGSTVTYTSPSANPGCANNVAIRVTDSSGNTADVPIANNAGYDSAMRLSDCRRILV
jgi:hypothetical protein